MEHFIYILHILTAILFIGPITVAVSVFPRIARAAATQPAGSSPSGALALVLSISRTYSMLSLLVPALGIGLLIAEPAYFENPRFHISLALSVVAWALLIFFIVPQQRKVAATAGVLDPDMDAHDAAPAAELNKKLSLLAAAGGVFNLLWLVTAVLMVL